ncbi:MAG: sulfite exporter TauE/SafE family protein [Gemmatimonadota bacterium]|jgi:hypothetical protein
MESTDPLLLAAAFGAALLAGAGNAVAGGGTNLSFPILVWLGLPPVAANATNGVGLWPGSVGAAWSYRGRIAEADRRWWWLVVPSVIGGGLGAWLLLSLPPRWFGAIAPYLVIGASILVAVEPTVRSRLRTHLGANAEGSRGGVAGALVAQLGIALYGGYFGAGMGILTLSALGLMGMDDIQRANGFKNMLTAAIKGVAVLYFVVAGVLVWPVALAMAAGSALGGYVSGLLAQKVSGTTLRWLVVAMGVTMGVAMLVTSSGG